MNTIKYLKTGEKVELIENLGAKGFLVQYYVTLCDYEGNDFEDMGKTQIVNMVYDKPPVAVLDKEIVEKQEKLDELERKINILNSSLYNNEKEVAERIKKLSTYKGLERIEDWLDGKLTHCVVCQYGNSWRISEFAKEFCGASSEYERHKKLKLLTFFGTNERTAEWKLSHYSDGSGSSDDVFVFTSESDAKKFLQDIINKADKNISGRMNLLECAKKYGLEYPMVWAEEKTAREAAARAERISKAEKQLELAKAGKSEFGGDI